MALFKFSRRRTGGNGVDSAYDTVRMNMEDPVPVEEMRVAEEPSIRDEQISRDEFNEHVSAFEEGTSGGSSRKTEYVDETLERRHERIKKNILRPIAATILGVTTILASFSVDPLGRDFLVAGLGVFPSLPNPDPDWDGEYAWSRMDQYLGPEYYIRYSQHIEDTYDYAYLTRGGAWEMLDPDTPLRENGSADGSIRYDRSSNTLILTDFEGSLIETNEMGNAFKIEVNGENTVEFIQIYGAGHSGSVTFTGNGKLTIGTKNIVLDGEDTYEGGLRLLGEMGITNEYGSACVMIDSGVTLDIYGTPALEITETAMQDAIYYKSPVKLQEGTVNCIPSRDPDEHPEEGYRDPVSYNIEIVDEEGNPLNHVIFAP